MSNLNIAIDGPAGAGKSTVAKLVADQLHYLYIDTGAMYRALTWKALLEDVNVHSDEDLVLLLKQCQIKLKQEKQGQKVFLNDQDVTEEIRSREVTNNVSFVASQPKVREEMLYLQRQMAAEGGVVMDGRDIGTHVLPKAEVKVFLSATIEERAQRRFLELQKKGEEPNFEVLKEEIRLRDERDSNREFAPLRKAEDAIEIDTTGLSIEDVVQRILHIVQGE